MGTESQPRRIGLGLMFLILFSACSQQKGDAPENGSAEVAPEEFEALMSLGYLDSTKDSVDAAHVGVVLHDIERAQDGYRLYCTRGRAIAQLLDVDGSVIQSWSDREIGRWTACALTPEGDLIVIGLERASDAEKKNRRPHRHLRRLSWDGEEIWRRDLPVHHDIFLLPGGDLLTILMEDRWRKSVHEDLPVRDDYVVRMSGGGEILDRRSILEVFEADPAELPLRVPAESEGEGPPALDIIHANTVSEVDWPHLEDRGPLYGSGNVIWTSRRQSTVAIVDWSSNRRLWSWGQGELIGPHEGQVLANGNVLIFDNGSRKSSSRVIEVDPLENEIVWEYRGEPPESFYTAARGGAERLENGNTLITESAEGRAFEVTADGEKVWEFLSPQLTDSDRRLTFRRMRHYPRAMIDQIRSKHDPR